MRPKVRIHRGLVATLSRNRRVQAALRRRADHIAARAEQIATDEQYEVNATVEEGVRSRSGRAYARVISADADQEFGTWGKKRRRILGRAADVKE